MEYQRQFFEFLKAKLPPEKPLTAFVEETLHVSRDGAYRRIVGKTILSLSETMRLLQARHLDFTDFFGETTGKMIFEQIRVGGDGVPTVLPNFHEFLRKSRPLEITMAANTFLRNNLFDFPDLSFFFSFYMAKSVVMMPMLEEVNFDLNSPMRDILVQQIDPLVKLWFDTPTIEIMHLDTINSMIYPILYYWDTNKFQNASTPLKLLSDVDQTINYMEAKVVARKSLRYGEAAETDRPSYQLYITEVPLMGNTGLIRSEHGQLVMHILNGFNLVVTANQEHCDKIGQYLSKLMEKSSNLATAGEKQRLQFFNNLRKRVDDVRRKIEAAA